MGSDRERPAKKNYTLKSVTKPLPSRVTDTYDASDCTVLANDTNATIGKRAASTANTPCFRDITEDDDGYHPYADVPDMRPLFERDPWD